MRYYRHEGWRLSLSQGLEPVRALFQADAFLPDIGSIARPFRGSSVPGSSTCIDMLILGFHFRANEASRPAGEIEMAQASRNTLIRLDSAEEIEGF